METNERHEPAGAGGVVIGTDGSAGSGAALRWGVREAAVRGIPARAVLAWSYLDQHHRGGGTRFDSGYDEKAAQEALAAAVEEAVGAEAALGVLKQTVCDLAPRALLDAALEADLLVVGARGLGGFRSLLLGSVSDQCLHHAACPVAVVREDPPASLPPDAPIVVGVDGSPDAVRALRWAIEEARARQVPLRVVQAWEPGFVDEVSVYPVVANLAEMGERAQAEVDALLAAEDTTGITVDAQHAFGPPARTLLEASADASLLVVGSRGRGGFAGLLLGSVSHQVTRHATCPVVVVRPGRFDRPAASPGA
jgi:nucleotide-binding universal stress UspA family protein